MQMVIDIGNSKTKAGFFKEQHLISNQKIQSLHNFELIIKENKPNHIVVGQVGHDVLGILNYLNEREISFLEVTSKTQLPIKSEYKTPETLGIDRMAAAIGAKVHFPNRGILVVDFGTCITYDFVTKESIYVGGAIAPGMNMRYKAMAQFTKGLPQLSFEGIPDVVGKSTSECMHSGVIHGIAHEVEKTIQHYYNLFSDFEIVFTGGDSKIFESMIKANIFANQNLILEGLNKILLSNVSEI